MTGKARLSFPKKPESDVELDKETNVIGRSRESDVMLVDPYISRKQAIISSELGSYTLRNIGRNPVQINGQTVQEAVLQDGDAILFGSTECVFHQPHHHAPVQEAVSDGLGTAGPESPVEQGTVVLSAHSREEAGPYLILTGPDKEAVRVELNKESFSIGRSSDADLNLSDSAVSRQHCVIECGTGGCTVTNHSRTNPVQVNSEPVSTARLSSGDQIRIGSQTMTFVSSREPDQRPSEPSQPQKTSSLQLAASFLLAALVLILGVYFTLTQVIQPWRISKSVDQGRTLLEQGQHREAIELLEGLLEKDLSASREHEAVSLLARSAIGAAEELTLQQSPDQAKSLLTSFLQAYGNTAAGEQVRARLDEYRLKEARALEESEDFQHSLHLYASISQNGPLADKARNGIRRIWLAFQQTQMEKQSVAELLKKAERNFIAKQYLTPVNQNAYAIYKAVLSIDPDNPVALKRIDEMKNFYARHGNRHFEAGRYSRALVYLERYAIIDPGNEAIKAKITTCRSRTTAGTDTTQPQPEDQATSSVDSAYQKQVQDMLKESESDSSRIMKYLFEDEAGEQTSESPW